MNNYSELRRDFYFGLGCIALSIFLMWGITATIDERHSSTGITARTFPYLINTFLFITGCILTVVAKGRLAKIETSQKTYMPAINKKQLRGLLCFVGILTLYLIGMATVGFLTSSIVALIAVHWLLGARNWLVIGLVSVLSSVSVWYLFVQVMGVQFPEAYLL